MRKIIILVKKCLTGKVLTPGHPLLKTPLITLCFRVTGWLKLKGVCWANVMMNMLLQPGINIFKPFHLDKNLIIFSDNDNRTDSAYINLITDGELTISIKKGEDFYQYEYKK